MQKRQIQLKIHKYKDKYTSQNDTNTQIQNAQILLCLKKSFLGLKDFQNFLKKECFFTKFAQRAGEQFRSESLKIIPGFQNAVSSITSLLRIDHLLPTRVLLQI